MQSSVENDQTFTTRHKLSVARLLTAGALSAALIFVLCWLGTLVPFSSPTHAYISLFTPEDMSSGAALVQGSFWSLLFGGLSGGVFAFIYNLVPFGRR